jgi:hypothetical protein
MMHNSTRSGALGDDSTDRKEPSVREADRAGKVGDAQGERSFTIRPKTAVIEISGGRVEVKVGKAAELRKA